MAEWMYLVFLFLPFCPWSGVICRSKCQLSLWHLNTMLWHLRQIRRGCKEKAPTMVVPKERQNKEQQWCMWTRQFISILFVFFFFFMWILLTLSYIINVDHHHQVRTAANTHTVAQHYQLQKYTLHCIFQLIKSDYVIIHQSILCDDPPPALLNPTTCLFNSYFLGLQFVVLTVFHTC